MSEDSVPATDTAMAEPVVIAPQAVTAEAVTVASAAAPDFALPVKPVAAAAAANNIASGSASGGAATSAAFKAPSSIPMDLELIMQMVGAEGGESTQASDGGLAASALGASLPAAAGDVAEVASDSSSSDSEDDESSSSDSDSGSTSDSSSADEAAAQDPETMTDSSPEMDGDIQLPSTSGASGSSKPMDAATHAKLLSQLTSWIGPPAGAEDEDDEAVEGYITADSSDGEGVEGSAIIVGGEDDVDMDAMKAAFAAKMAESSSDEDESDEDAGAAAPEDRTLEGMDNDDDEDDGPAEVPVTAHELPLPPVQPPKIAKLPEGEKLVLAGEVMSYVLEPGVEQWWREHLARGMHADKDETSNDAHPAESVAHSEAEVTVPVGAEASESAPSTSGELTAAEVAVEGSAPSTASSAPAPTVSTSNPAPSAPSQAEQTPEENADATATVATAPASAQTAQPTSNDRAQGANKNKQKRRGKKGKSTGGPGGSTRQWASSGTIVVRAVLGESLQQSGSYSEDGWLEEGSLICDAERNVIASIAETFGPLSSPFYLLRLPPPPHPIPSRTDLPVGTKLYYPAEHDRSFVPVRMLRTDKRFKGTDASNFYDEEVDDDEMEWSDDEQEQLAKQARKKAARANARGASATPSQNGSRPRHFDAGGFEDRVLDYERANGSAHQDAMETSSIASSSRTNRSRLVAYDDIAGGVPSLPSPPPRASGERGRGGRGRGGRGGPPSDRGNGRPPQSAQRGGRNVGRGFGRGGGQQNARNDSRSNQGPPPQQQQPPQPMGMAPMPTPSGPINGGQPGFNFGANAGMMTGANPFMMMGMQPGFGSQAGYGMQPGFGAPQGGVSGGGVVNPRFAAMQYQQMMAMAAAQAQMWQHHQQGQGPPQ